MNNYNEEVIKARVPNRRIGRFYGSRYAPLSVWKGCSGRRFFDVVFSVLLIILLIIPMLLVAVIIKLTSPGPVFFLQNRLGLKGKVFKIIKFRTMYDRKTESTDIQTKPGDPRITPVGRILRSSSMDELPQLINILMGDMTFVGPRPHNLKLNDKYRHSIINYMQRYDVKPGITGWAQVNGLRGYTPNRRTMADRLEYDLWYIKNHTLWLDIKIILKTFIVILDWKNAY